MENLPIRDFNEFCEQLNEIRIKFHKWDTCEKTVGLYYLMVGLPFANARFLQNALERSIISDISLETKDLENNANDLMFVSSFYLEPPQTALSLLLTHLPLLKPGNKETAECYLKSIRKVLLEFMVPPLKIHNECVEIMSYVYIHPAFSNEDKKTFKHLLKRVLDNVCPDNFMFPASDSGDESESTNWDYQQNVRRMNRRSYSLIPGQLSSDELVMPNRECFEDCWYSNENLSQPPSKPRSFSLSSDKSLLIGSHSLQASISETRLQDLILMNNRTAMKSIVSWLKSLRLHKYSWVFNNLTFSQMINLTEESLQSIGITKGARHKLLINIAKLKERNSMLIELETEVMNGGDLNLALKKLKSVLQSPLQLTLGEDLQSQFVKVTGKVYTQLLMLRQPSDELLMSFNSLCERAETIEDAFTEEQKKRLTMWRNQLMKADTFPVYNHQDHASVNNRRKHTDNKHCLSKICSIPSSYTKKSSSFPNMKNNSSLNTHRHSVGSVTLQNQLFTMHQNQQLLHNGDQSYNESSNRLFNSNNITWDCNKPAEHNSHNMDIESSLESLCIQMMEHALGP